MMTIQERAEMRALLKRTAAAVDDPDLLRRVIAELDGPTIYDQMRSTR